MIPGTSPFLNGPRRYGLVVILLLGLGVALVGPAGVPERLSERLLLAEAERAVAENALGPLPESQDLERGMIEGMLQALDDPYAAFLHPPQGELEAQLLSGHFGGIGASLGRTTDGTYYLVPFEAGPAGAAGIVAGDLLIRIDGQPIEPSSDEDVIQAELRGEVGTRVELQVQRGLDAGTRHDVLITRARYQLPSIVSYQIPGAPHVGLIHVSAFTSQTATELETHFSSLMSTGVRALVLDLRVNQGGLLDSALQVADFFLAEGIIYFEVRQKTELVASANPGDPGERIPLAVVIDGTTISAAELVAGALQANDRADLFGGRTYGKGTVQTLLPLSDGSSLHVTSATWLTPNRQQIEGNGIEPDTPFDPTITNLPDATALAVASLLTSPAEAGDG